VKCAGVSAFTTTYFNLGMQCLRLILQWVTGLQKRKWAHYRERVKVRAKATTSGNTIWEGGREGNPWWLACSLHFSFTITLYWHQRQPSEVTITENQDNKKPKLPTTDWAL